MLSLIRGAVELTIGVLVILLLLRVGSGLEAYFGNTPLPYKPAILYDYKRADEVLTPEQREEYWGAEEAMTNSKNHEDYTKALSVWRMYSEIIDENKNAIIKSSRLPQERIEALVKDFSVKIQREPIHDLFDQCGSIWVEDGMNNFIGKTGNRHPEYSYPVIFQDWMGAFGCHTYAFHMIRREDPFDFADPHGVFDPVGLLIAQGYQPIPANEIQENDLVFYFSYRKDPDFDPAENPPGGLVSSSHYGVGEINFK